MTFNFSIRTALKQSWQSFRQHPLFFAGMAFVMIIFNFFLNYHRHNYVLVALVVIASIVWSYVWISTSLAAIDGKDAILNYKALSIHLPTVRQFFMLVIIGVIVGLITAAGFILLIIPGIYFMTRLAFANISYVDRQGSVKASLNHSWHLVKGRVFWTVLLVVIVEIALIVIGTLLFGVGLLITYPIAMLLIAHLYRSLDIYHRTVVKEVHEVVA
jgi:hypothetical protein